MINALNKDQVKLVVTDEDGTFLDLGGEDFSRERFAAVFDRMRACGTRFAVATSNQSFQVKEIFGELAQHISVIASNGAYVEPEGSKAQVRTASEAAVRSVLAAHGSHPEIPLCAVCADGAFVERGCDPGFSEEMAMYSHNLHEVASLADAAATMDVLMYWSRVDARDLKPAVELLAGAVEGMDVVDSGYGDGYGYLDVIQPGVNKATGIQTLLDVFGIDASGVMAFGDAGNDAQMIRLAGMGVAMGNASDELKEIADIVCEPCREQGVLKVLESVFGR